MRALLLHAEEFEYTPVQKEVDVAEAAEQGRKCSFKEVLVAMTSVEEGDGEAEAEAMADEIASAASRLGVASVLVYPYAHLSNRLASPERAVEVISALARALEDRGLQVHRAPFGWTKSFSVRVKGHPLAEQLRVVEPGAVGRVEEREEAEEKFHRYIVVDVDGSEYEVTPENWEDAPVFRKEGVRYEALRYFVRNELVGKPPSKEPPRHIYYMRKLELVDYCPESDAGHMKWYPNGALIRDLILDYAFYNVARKWGAMKMQNPLLYRMDIEAIRMLQGEFHERDYIIDEGGRKLVLRFASDPGAFPFVQKVLFTYRHTPLKVYEEALCFRKEQRGELTGLMRVRNFLMTDHHAFCLNEEQGKREYRELSLLFKKLMDDVISGEYWVLGFEVVEEYYERYKDFIKGLIREMGVPALIKIMKRMTHYYAFKSEYQAVFSDGSNVQISTVQWDVKNGQRFNITYVDADGSRKPIPIILHASSFGSIERALASILEKAAWDEKRGLNPVLPFWLAPEQVRVVPVDVDRHLEHANRLADELERRGFRVGVDDRRISVAKKVFEAKTSWIPYIVVIGDREVKEGYYTVTPREGYGVGKEPKLRMTLEELVEELERKQRGFPRRPMYLPRELSRRPSFTGVR